MSLESNKTVVRQFIECLGRGDVAGIETVIAPGIKAVCTGTSVLSGSRGHADICAAAAALSQMTRNGIEFHILSMTAEDDRVSCEAEGRSELVNGRAYNNEYHFLFYIEGGRIVGIREYMDSRLVDDALGPLLSGAAG